MTHRYIVEFRDIGQEYFRADCGFRAGQEDLARQYVRLIVGTLAHVAEGRVTDASSGVHVYTLRPQDKLTVNIELHLHWLSNSLAAVTRSTLTPEQAHAITERLIAHYAAQIAQLFQKGR